MAYGAGAAGAGYMYQIGDEPVYDVCRLQTADCRPQTADRRPQTADRRP